MPTLSNMVSLTQTMRGVSATAASRAAVRSPSASIASSPSRRAAAAHFSTSSTARARPGPGKGLNRHSRIITQPKDQGASQAMLYATEGIEQDQDLGRAMVGVASVWWAELSDKKSMKNPALTS